MSRLLIADSCVGGLSVVRTLTPPAGHSELLFLADYAINPLGTKTDAQIKDVVERWITAASLHADALLIACNTLSIRYRQLRRQGLVASPSLPVTSMVDYFAEMVTRESAVLRDAKVLIVGTQFTSMQPLFSELLREHADCSSVTSFAATRLERQIARFEDGELFEDEGFEAALSCCDVAILACTCFPFVIDALQSRFPTVRFLDPAAVLDNAEESPVQSIRISIVTTGQAVMPEQVARFAAATLGDRFDAKSAPMSRLGLE